MAIVNIEKFEGAEINTEDLVYFRDNGFCIDPESGIVIELSSAGDLLLAPENVTHADELDVYELQDNLTSDEYSLLVDIMFKLGDHDF